MDMRKFKSVKIMHDNIHRADFTYLAEFFRLMGIFVCEDILVEKNREETTAEKNTVYDACIYVGNREVKEDELAMLSWERGDYETMLKQLPETTCFFYEEAERILSVLPQREEDVFLMPVYRFYSCEQQEQLLRNLLELFLRGFDEKQAVDAGGFNELIKIYVTNELMLHSINMQYFSKRPSDVIFEARTAFRKGHKKITRLLLKEMPEEIRMYYEYARLWLEVKINSACDYLQDIYDFSIDKLAERCMKLINCYPDFTNAKILLGLSYEPSVSNANEALAAYLAALRDINGECFASPVYYWMGKRYESYNRSRDDAEKSYEIANQKKRKFRNYFKLAIFAKNKKDYTEAIKLFQEIANKLEMKKELEYTDPLELEYIFKSYGQQCFCYYQQEKYPESIRMGHEAESLWTEIEEGKYDRYFRIFYGVEKFKDKKYRKLLLDRLGRASIYSLLSDAYRKMLNVERANLYRERAAELRKKSDYESEKGKILWGVKKGK